METFFFFFFQSSSRSGMKQETSEAFAQTLSLQELLQQLKVNRNEKKQEKLKVFSSSPKEDTGMVATHMFVNKRIYRSFD